MGLKRAENSPNYLHQGCDSLLLTPEYTRPLDHAFLDRPSQSSTQTTYVKAKIILYDFRK